MSKSINQKIKLLVLWDILFHNTDENRALSTDEIIALLKEKDIDVVRKVLHEDIALLNEFDYEVLSYKKKSYYYYVVTRPLETAEAVMLSDAVSATKLPETQKTSLIGRLSETSGTANKGMFGYSPLKRTNRHILYSIDKIERAIAEEKKVSFLYFSLDYKKNKVYRKDGNRYVVNPLATVRDRDNYYLICYDDKHPSTANYRIDRMEKVEIEENGRTFKPEYENFNVENYRRQVFSMYGGETERVELSFPEDLIDEIYDKFGEQTEIYKVSENTYRTIVPVQISPTFFSWVAGSCGKLKILSPNSVLKKFTEFIRKIKDSY